MDLVLRFAPNFPLLYQQPNLFLKSLVRILSFLHLHVPPPSSFLPISPTDHASIVMVSGVKLDEQAESDRTGSAQAACR
jgi:hypothetical protein